MEININTILLGALNITTIGFGFMAKRHVDLQDSFNKEVRNDIKNLMVHGCAYCQKMNREYVDIPPEG